MSVGNLNEHDISFFNHQLLIKIEEKEKLMLYLVINYVFMFIVIGGN